MDTTPALSIPLPTKLRGSVYNTNFRVVAVGLLLVGLCWTYSLHAYHQMSLGAVLALGLIPTAVALLIVDSALRSNRTLQIRSELAKHVTFLQTYRFAGRVSDAEGSFWSLEIDTLKINRFPDWERQIDEVRYGEKFLDKESYSIRFPYASYQVAGSTAQMVLGNAAILTRRDDPEAETWVTHSPAGTPAKKERGPLRVALIGV